MSMLQCKIYEQMLLFIFYYVKWIINSLEATTKWFDNVFLGEYGTMVMEVWVNLHSSHTNVQWIIEYSG